MALTREQIDVIREATNECLNDQMTQLFIAVQQGAEQSVKENLHQTDATVVSRVVAEVIGPVFVGLRAQMGTVIDALLKMESRLRDVEKLLTARLDEEDQSERWWRGEGDEDDE